MTSATQSFTLGVAVVGGDFQLGAPDTITATGIDSLAVFGSGTFVRTIAPAGIDARAVFGTPTIGQTILATGVDSLAVFGSPALTPGSVSVAVAGIDARAQFGAPSSAISQGLVVGQGLVGVDVMGSTVADVGIAGIDSRAVFGHPIIYTPNITATGIDARPTFGAPTLVTGIIVAGIDSRARFGRVDLYPAAARRFGAGLFGDGVFGGAPALADLAPSAQPFVVGQSLVGGDDALGAPGAGLQRIIADRIWPPSPQFGTVQLEHTIRPAGIDARAQFGTPSFGASVFVLAGIDARPVFGQVRLGGSVPIVGIDARAVFGVPSLVPIIRVQSIPVVVQWGVVQLLVALPVAPFSSLTVSTPATGPTQRVAYVLVPASGPATAELEPAVGAGTLGSVTATGDVRA